MMKYTFTSLATTKKGKSVVKQSVLMHINDFCDLSWFNNVHLTTGGVNTTLKETCLEEGGGRWLLSAFLYLSFFSPRSVLLQNHKPL